MLNMQHCNASTFAIKRQFVFMENLFIHINNIHEKLNFLIFRNFEIQSIDGVHYE